MKKKKKLLYLYIRAEKNTKYILTIYKMLVLCYNENVLETTSKKKGLKKMRTKELSFINKLSNDRIKEKEQTLQNDKLILDYMNRNNINTFNNTTKDELIQHIKKLEEYIKISRGGIINE